MENTALVKQDTNFTLEGTSLVADLTTAEVSFCSMIAETLDEKKALFTAMNNPTKKLDECVNMTIMAKDVYAESLQFVDEKTGEIQPGVRIVIIDTEGNSYGCCAMGVFSALKKLFKVFGMPTWEEGIAVTPYTVPSRRVPNGKVLTLKLA